METTIQLIIDATQSFMDREKIPGEIQSIRLTRVDRNIQLTIFTNAHKFSKIISVITK